MSNSNMITLLNIQKKIPCQIRIGYIIKHLKPGRKEIKHIIRYQYPGKFSGDPSSDLYTVPTFCANHTVLQAVLREVNHKPQPRESD